MLARTHGLDDATARGALMVSAAHPLADKWLSFGAMSVVRVGAARVGLVGGALMITGYVCYFGLVFQGYATIALAQHGGATPDHVADVDLTTSRTEVGRTLGRLRAAGH